MNTATSAYRLHVREKLLNSGAHSLSDLELLAVFISSDSAGKSCLQLASDLYYSKGDLRSVLNSDLQGFLEITGLGSDRYFQLQAAKEICLRSDFIHLKKKVKLTGTLEAAEFLKKKLRDKKYEVFSVLFLDNQHRLISYEEMFHGNLNAATVYTRPIIDRLIQLNAAAVILAHNHPSGDCSASKEDIQVTKRIEKALHLLEARLLDHFIIGDNEIFSVISRKKIGLVFN